MKYLSKKGICIGQEGCLQKEMNELLQKGHVCLDLLSGTRVKDA